MVVEEKLSYYFARSESVDRTAMEKRIRIAILGSFTLTGVEKVLAVKCADNKVDCSTYVSGYGQYSQEILNPQSELYKFSPDITFLILDTRSMLKEMLYSPYSLSSSERREYVGKLVIELINLAEAFAKRSKSKLIMSNFSVPTYSPYGILETKTEYSLQDMIRDMNSQLVSLLISEPAIYIYDYNGFVTKHGETNVFDYRQFLFGDIKVALNYIPYLAAELMAYVKALMGLNRKCIVLDLDNTLWGGVVGEDGFDGIKLGPNPPGNSYVEFQRHIFSLYQRGIILAINSKNNPDDATQVLKEHPYMILKEEHFATTRINWDDKVSNMREIAAELNIGLDSMVYIDDDPINREIMKKALPEILTLDLPNAPSLYTPVLLSLNDFSVLGITPEDARRGEMYLQQKKRSDLRKTAPDLHDYLSQLGIRIRIKKADQFTIPRISQLILKTNQFNLTTQRYREEDVRKFSEDPNMLLGCAQVEDKFGDNGITAAFIVRKDNQCEWTIDTFLLSCRVLGRGVEDAIMGSILNKAKEEGVTKIRGKYIPTAKNKSCIDFLPNNGFKREGDYWVYIPNQTVRIPNYLQLFIE